MSVFIQYVKHKKIRIFAFLVCLFVPSIVLYLSGIDLNLLILAALLCIFLYTLFFTLEYKQYKKEKQQVDKVIRNLDLHYLSQELLSEPSAIEAKDYYTLIKLANKDMCDQIALCKSKQREYKELIEEWVHEIKTPLTSLELLYDKHFCPDAEIELEKCKSILDCCLNYIRMDTLEKDYHVESVNISNLLHELIIDNKTSIRAKDLHIDMQIDSTYTLLSDRKWLHFILSQILNNAIKYSNEQGSLTFSIKNEASFVWLGIADTGCGIHSEDLPRIFEKGFTGSTLRRNSASGIGLYLVKNCLDKLNLKSRVHSEPDKGTLFEIGFPVDNISIL